MGGETYQVYGYGFVIEEEKYRDFIKDEDIEELEEMGYTYQDLNNLNQILSEYDDDFDDFDDFDDKIYKEILEKFKKENPVNTGKFYNVYYNMYGQQVYLVYDKYTHNPLDLEDFVKLKNENEKGDLISKMDNFAKKFSVKPKWLVWFIDNE